jgi:hypothetical protein
MQNTEDDNLKGDIPGIILIQNSKTFPNRVSGTLSFELILIIGKRFRFVNPFLFQFIGQDSNGFSLGGGRARFLAGTMGRRVSSPEKAVGKGLFSTP